MRERIIQWWWYIQTKHEKCWYIYESDEFYTAAADLNWRFSLTLLSNAMYISNENRILSWPHSFSRLINSRERREKDHSDIYIERVSERVSENYIYIERDGRCIGWSQDSFTSCWWYVFSVLDNETRVTNISEKHRCIRDKKRIYGCCHE